MDVREDWDLHSRRDPTRGKEVGVCMLCWGCLLGSELSTSPSIGANAEAMLSWGCKAWV